MKEREREASWVDEIDREMARQIDRQTDRQTDR